MLTSSYLELLAYCFRVQIRNRFRWFIVRKQWCCRLSAYNHTYERVHKPPRLCTVSIMIHIQLPIHTKFKICLSVCTFLYVCVLIVGRRFRWFVVGGWRLSCVGCQVSAVDRRCWLSVMSCWYSVLAVVDNFDCRCPALSQPSMHASVGFHTSLSLTHKIYLNFLSN